ncbi:N-acetylglucosamine kinase [Pseudoflavitalea sp. G-6-1-2]|uniref:N-acetylglucosamine kinase n=1 Tax=Pseudoflavitalea sp. G-6-1-2 TaxID=2728841 RepID=UPI00146DB217|nr:N-acetylglucosamine kinase [Pseudoflavitalea sp. G-6-1-2]NML23225.1 N-acetylglucosamine kinase [Pseudoflavitalea sp. G-6-1-2]
MAILIADSGSTKAEWALAGKGRKTRTVFTQGISPYFLNTAQIEGVLRNELIPGFKKAELESIEAIYYYGTGCSNPENVKSVKAALSKVFKGIKPIEVTHDLMGVARASCGHEKGIACILGTGSNTAFYNGKKIMKVSPGLGYALGDEGSGAYLGKKVIQYYLYGTFDEELRYRFDQKYHTNSAEILDNVYKKPLPNRYLASFALFLAENRDHYMIENIIEDGLNDFFFTHLCKLNESWKMPIHFIGSVGFAFKDVLADLCHAYEFELGKVLKNPMAGLIKYHLG